MFFLHKKDVNAKVTTYNLPNVGDIRYFVNTVTHIVTIDGVGLTAGFIGLHTVTHNYSVPTTVDLHTRLHFTVLQWQRLLSLCYTALSQLSLSRAQDLLQNRLLFSHWLSLAIN
jgi:hypothetical protein